MNKILITGFLILLTSLYCFPQAYSLKLYHNKNDMLKLQTDKYAFSVDDERNELKSEKAYRIYFKLNPPDGSSFNSKQVNVKAVDKKGGIAAEKTFQLVSDKSLDSCLDVPKGNYDIRVYDDNNRLVAKSEALEVSFSPGKQSELEEQNQIESHELIAQLNFKSGETVNFAFTKAYTELYLTISSDCADKTPDDVFVFIDNGTDVQRVALTNIKSFRKVEYASADVVPRNFEISFPNARGISVTSKKDNSTNQITVIVRGQ